MMRRKAMVAILAMTILAGPAVVLAEPVPAKAAVAKPPARPIGLTPAQFDSIRQLETRSDHAAALNVHATYKSDRERNLDFTRASDDFWTAVYQGGFPGAIALMLILGAPL